jgi:LPXTG-motif cell wall-anchored protein
MGDRLDALNSSSKASGDRARARAQGAFRSMLLVFAVGFAALAVVAFIATGEIGAVLLVVFGFIGIAVCGWFGKRWLLRNIGGG